jgi:hypothetical protein
MYYPFMNIGREAYNRDKVQEIIDMYSRMYPSGPDSIGASILLAKEEQRELQMTHAVNNRTGVIKNSEVNRRLLFVIPQGLYMMLVKKFPAIFKSELKYFKRDFPVFFNGWKP